MTSAREVEVLSVVPHGLWMRVKEKAYLLPFTENPWFQEARVADIFEVELLFGQHLHWPALDVDLPLNALVHPERFPLVSKVSKPRKVRNAPSHGA